MKKFRLHRIYDAYQFEGDGASGDAGAQAGSEGEAAANDTQTEDTKAEDATKPMTFKDMLKSNPEYQAEFDKSVQSAIKRRFKDYDSLRESNEKYANLMGIMHDAYPDSPDDGDIESMTNYLQQKSSIWADAAAEAGMPVEAYKQMKRFERENAMLMSQQRAAVEQQQREAKFAQWNAQVPIVQQAYPDFDINVEVQNPRFIGLLDMGWDMKSAYEGVHHQELMSGAVRTAAQQATQQTASAIKAQQGRPVENGAATKTAIPGRIDPSKLTDEQLDELNARIRNGERMSF